MLSHSLPNLKMYQFKSLPGLNTAGKLGSQLPLPTPFSLPGSQLPWAAFAGALLFVAYARRFWIKTGA
jgi:hypothetical protein